MGRSNKKHEVKAKLIQSLKNKIAYEAALHGISQMSYAAKLSMQALEDEKIIRSCSPYFKRSYIKDNKAWIGHVIAPSPEALLPEGESYTMLSVRFTEEEYLALGEFAHALCCPMYQALSILITEAIAQGIGGVECAAR